MTDPFEAEADEGVPPIEPIYDEDDALLDEPEDEEPFEGGDEFPEEPE